MESRAKAGHGARKPGAGQSVSVVARRNGINANQLFLWRKLYQEGSLSAVSAGEAVVPASELNDALKQIRELQRMLGKRPWKPKCSKRPWRSLARENGLRTHPCCRGRPVKLVSESLGVSRSQLTVRLKQGAQPKARRARHSDDTAVVAEIQGASW
nr:transposase [Pseudomonas syringae]